MIERILQYEMNIKLSILNPHFFMQIIFQLKTIYDMTTVIPKYWNNLKLEWCCKKMIKLLGIMSVEIY